MAQQRTIVFGTANRKKAVELVELLAPRGWQLKTLADFGEPLNVDETGTSFAENAALKATRQAVHLRQWVLGDDSGLCVDALQGGPGIYSARFAGSDASDADNRRKLLDTLAGVPAERRGAHFVCHLVLADPTGAVRAEAVGRCQGRILQAESGSGGFGYDPIVLIDEFQQTLAEVDFSVTCDRGFRARAAQALFAKLTSEAPQ